MASAPVTMTVTIPADAATRIRANDTAYAQQLFAFVRSKMPPEIAEGQRWRGPNGEIVELVAFRGDHVVVFFPARPDPGSRAGMYGMRAVQEAVESGRWKLEPVPAAAAGGEDAVGDGD